MTPPRILLAEDDPDDAHFMKRAFLKVSPGVSLEVAKDGQVVVDLLSNPGLAKPGFLLLDLKLPKKPGLEVLEWIRNTPALAHLRVMVLSSSENALEIERATRLGIDAFFVKPVGFPALVELVRTICRTWSIEHAIQKTDAGT